MLTHHEIGCDKVGRRLFEGHPIFLSHGLPMEGGRLEETGGDLEKFVGMVGVET